MTFGTFDHLISRISRRESREIVFVVGSGVTAPWKEGAKGVPGTQGIIDLIQEEFRDDSDMQFP